MTIDFWLVCGLVYCSVGASLAVVSITVARSVPKLRKKYGQYYRSSVSAFFLFLASYFAGEDVGPVCQYVQQYPAQTTLLYLLAHMLFWPLRLTWNLSVLGLVLLVSLFCLPYQIFWVGRGRRMDFGLSRAGNLKQPQQDAGFEQAGEDS